MTTPPCGEPYALTCSTVEYLVDGAFQLDSGVGGETLRGVCKDVLETIGRTPMVRLNRVVPARAAERAALSMIEDLAGTSSGVAVCAAIRVAEELDPGKRVVTIVADTGRNYLSSCLDPKWRAERGLP